jgi:hypothetical protein
MNQKKKIKGSTYLAAAHLAEDQAGPTPSPAAQPTYRFDHLQPRGRGSSVELCQAPDLPPAIQRAG